MGFFFWPSLLVASSPLHARCSVVSTYLLGRYMKLGFEGIHIYHNQINSAMGP